jgi:hypothetical protein
MPGANVMAAAAAAAASSWETGEIYAFCRTEQGGPTFPDPRNQIAQMPGIRSLERCEPQDDANAPAP